jgi:hypothetical protein
MTDHVDLERFLDQARKHGAREAKPETPEQRKSRRAKSRWHRNINWIWYYAHQMTDDELRWFVTVIKDPMARAARPSTNSSGRASPVSGPATINDALQLENLKNALGERNWKQEEQRRRENCRKVADALTRLGLPVPGYFDCYFTGDEEGLPSETEE